MQTAMSAQAPKTPRILFVDDDERNLLAAEAALTDDSFELVLVRSGVDALRTLMESDFSVIVLDVMMPELDGLETARQIRARDKHRDTPIIFVTAHSQDDSRLKEACALGAIDFLSKPFAIELLRAKLRTLVRMHALEVAQAQDRFLSTLAQELRSPLSSLMLDLHVLKQHREAQNLRPLVASLDRSVQRLHRMVEEALDVSRLRQGRIQLRLAAAELGSVIDQAIELVRPTLERFGHELTLSPHPDVVPLMGDAERLAQAVGELLVNAAQHTEPGSPITLSYGQQAGEVWVSVEDEGRGIEPSLLPHVFDLYSMRGPLIEGLGLGLVRVREVMLLHGGSASASSAGPGKGSTFELRWPTQPGEARATRLLVIDDNDDIRETTAALLRLEGFLVEEAPSGQEGIERATTQRFDLILLDLGMPGMDGLETAGRLKRALGRDTPPLVAVTGFGSAADRARTTAAGFSEHLVKPVDPHELPRVLRRLLRPA
jgi:CheY-like chemotaxis protein/anti-sigma regulatory factor (Ser/Thr protein kinase)